VSDEPPSRPRRLTKPRPVRPPAREDVWDTFVDELDRAGQAGLASEVRTPTNLHPDAPCDRCFGELTRGEVDTLVKIGSSLGRRGDVVKTIWDGTRRQLREQQRRTPKSPTPRIETPPPSRQPPAADPAEAVERVLSRRQLLIEPGDIVLRREPASPSNVGRATTWTYALSIHLNDPRRRPCTLYARYDVGVMTGEELAVRRRVRLYYDEDGTMTLLKDYRPAR
jgi:hypothetical protein